jgi:hypothetical protein
MQYFPKTVSGANHAITYDGSTIMRRIMQRAHRSGLNLKKILNYKPYARLKDNFANPITTDITSLQDFQTLMRTTVILCHTKQAVVRYCALFKPDETALFYVTDKSQEQRDLALKFFTDMGFEVEDFTEKYYQHYPNKPYVKGEKKPKADPRTLPLMGNLIMDGRLNRRGHIVRENPVVSADYPAVICMNDTAEKNFGAKFVVPWGRWSDDVNLTLVKTYADQIAIAPTLPKWYSMVQTYKKQDGIEFILNDLYAKFHAVSNVWEKVAVYKFANSYDYRHGTVGNFLKRIHVLPQRIKDTIPMISDLNSDELKWIRLYVHLIGQQSWSYSITSYHIFKQVQADVKQFDGIKSTPTLDRVKELLANPYLEYVELEKIMTALRDLNRNDPKTVPHQIFLETLLLRVFG